MILNHHASLSFSSPCLGNQTDYTLTLADLGHHATIIPSSLLVELPSTQQNLGIVLLSLQDVYCCAFIKVMLVFGTWSKQR